MTTFSLVRHPWEYRQCHQLLKKLNRHSEGAISDPVIKAVRDEKFVGFASTAPLKEKKAVILAELAVDPDIKHPGFLMLKLMETYDAFLYSNGVTIWQTCVPLDQKEWKDTVERILGKPFHTDNQYAWFKRST